MKSGRRFSDLRLSIGGCLETQTSQQLRTLPVFAVVLIGATGCQLLPDGDVAICDPPSHNSAVVTAAESAGPERAFVAATWFKRSSPCASGKIGAAIYDVNLLDGSVRALALPGGTGAGGRSDREFVVLPGITGPAPDLYVLPFSGDLELIDLPGTAKAISQVGDRLLVAIETPPTLVFRGPGSATGSITPNIAPRGVANAFGTVWLNGESSVERLDRFTLVSLGTTPTCSSDGPIMPVGSLVAVQCADGGALALSSSGALVDAAPISQSRFDRIEGSESSPFGLASADQSIFAFSFESNLSNFSAIGSLEDAPVYLSSSMAIVATSRTVLRADMINDTAAVALANAPEGVAQIALVTSGAGLIVAQGSAFGANATLHVIEPETGVELREAISLPEPEFYFATGL